MTALPLKRRKRVSSTQMNDCSTSQCFSSFRIRGLHNGLKSYLKHRQVLGPAVVCILHLPFGEDGENTDWQILTVSQPLCLRRESSYRFSYVSSKQTGLLLLVYKLIRTDSLLPLPLQKLLRQIQYQFCVCKSCLLIHLEEISYYVKDRPFSSLTQSMF